MSQSFIGTSGWSYDHWQKIFYPEDLKRTDWLEFYASHFRTVEVNASFYHLPKKKTFENWRKTVGPPAGGFIFSVKGSRYITHIKRLKGCGEPVGRFFESVDGLFTSEVSPRRRRGPSTSEVVLWQLPPRMKKDLERLRRFLKLLPKEYRYAFEFRHESWVDKEVFREFREFGELGSFDSAQDESFGSSGIAVVFQDFDYWPMTEEVTADFVYIRLHGKKELYASCYTKKELEDWAKKIKRWLKKGLDVYVYFNNDMNGHAVKNTRQLIDLISN